MIKQITSLDDPTLERIVDDPIRPHIPAADRITANKKAFHLTNEDDKVLAIVCVAFTDAVATTESELNRYSHIDHTNVCMFYTLWSYTPGAGRELALEMLRYIKEKLPNIKRVVTLSPKTEMARRFHLKNGACELQVNQETVNFEYKLDR
jgi:hypothetical protein